mmetsp:Transcript_65863/g.137531  ORF Transcript_65863/g.137531 Transcript_65863/m.137531 type:complete len:97 (-) Transcript_65863:577-867(-)
MKEDESPKRSLLQLWPQQILMAAKATMLVWRSWIGGTAGQLHSSAVILPDAAAAISPSTREYDLDVLRQAAVALLGQQTVTALLQEEGALQQSLLP